MESTRMELPVVKGAWKLSSFPLFAMFSRLRLATKSIFYEKPSRQITALCSDAAKSKLTLYDRLSSNHYQPEITSPFLHGYVIHLVHFAEALG